MDDPMLDSMADVLLRELAAAFQDSLPPANVQVIVRPIVAWPDGKPCVWVMINWPN
jgi:hypothetical protein